MAVDPVMEILCPRDCEGIVKAEKEGRQMLADMLAELEDLINA